MPNVSILLPARPPQGGYGGGLRPGRRLLIRIGRPVPTPNFPRTVEYSHSSLLTFSSLVPYLSFIIAVQPQAQRARAYPARRANGATATTAVQAVTGRAGRDRRDRP